jgi:sensor histidine kinase regulating citrate/malate metabolism
MKNIIYRKSFLFKNLNEEFENIIEKIKKEKLNKKFKQFLVYVIGEIFDNIKEHSRAKQIVVKIIKKGKDLYLYVYDNGIGFRNSYISKNIIPKDDISAIEFALAGLSTKNLQERGYGLFSIRRIVEYLNGKIIIKSGKASAIITRNKIQFKETLFKKGVEILVEVPIKGIDIYKILK